MDFSRKQEGQKLALIKAYNVRTSGPVLQPEGQKRFAQPGFLLPGQENHQVREG